MSKSECGCELEHSYYCANCYTFLEHKLAEAEKKNEVSVKTLASILEWVKIHHDDQLLNAVEYTLKEITNVREKDKA